MNELRFSIVIPTYNRASFLQKTVEMILTQNFQDFELLVIDDGSTDDTEQLVKSMKDDRIFYYKITNRERGAARNYGALKAKGRYVNFFDSDDLAYPNHLNLAERIINEKGSPDVFALSYEIVNDQKELLKTVKLNQPVSEFITAGNHLSCNGVFQKREIAIANPFNEDCELSGSEDYELWLRLSARFTFPCFPAISHAVVQHVGRSTSNFNPAPIILRKRKMIEYAFRDKYVINKYSHHRKKLESGTFSYIALHLSLGKHKTFEILKWWLKAFRSHPSSLFSRRTLTIFRHTLLP